MNTPNARDPESKDTLPLEFDPPAANPAEDATMAVRCHPDAPPAGSEPLKTAATAQEPPRRTAPLNITRRPDALATQNIPEELRAAARTVPASALPGGSGKAREQRPQVQYGRILAEQRRKLNMSCEDVDRATMIRREYIEALENEDVDRLPPPVYVIAYVRKLGKFYKLDGRLVEEVVGELKARMEYTVPEDVISNLEFDTDAERENERTIKRILLALIIGLPAVILLILLIVFLASGSDRDAKAVNEASGRLPESRLEPLLPPPVLEIPELPPR